ncbi:MAG: hypothetical protein KA371_11380 [Acidobacteria bacterium]|nr:hypothetical protein [Acidobacteriota bacterium]
MALSWTQGRLGPFCSYAEDCTLVMQAIARPDGRDRSVTDLPFNWNAGLAEGGTPTSVVFYAPPYRELALLALAKAYQDRMRWHERAPALA